VQKKIYETGNIQPMKLSGLKIGLTREEALMNSALDVQGTTRVPDTEVHLQFYICVALWKFTSSAHRKFL
jgi:hypothetical protein